MFKSVLSDQQTSKESMIAILCILGSVGLVVVAFVAHQNFETVIHKDLKIGRTNKAIIFTENVIAKLVDAETNQRGYIIANDSAYLDVYTDSKQATYNDLDSLKALSRERHRQQTYLAALSAQVNRRVQLVDNEVRLKNTQQEAALQQFYARQHSRKVMHEAMKIAQAI